MIILDENIPRDQRELLQNWGRRLKQIGYDFGRQGLKDAEEIVPLLHSIRQPVLFTRDMGFFKRRFCHRRYGVVCLDIVAEETARYIRRFLRHAKFNTNAKRMGKVVRVSPQKIHYWSLKMEKEVEIGWET